MKKSDIIGIIIALAVLLGVPAIPLISTVTKREVIVERQPNAEKKVDIPPIDMQRPATKETATFSMG
jgi:uncharacterized alpha/beta hydrolase family protein